MDKMKPYLAYFNICVLWGTSNVVGKIGLSSLNVSVFTFIRYIITGFILLIISLIFKLKFPKKPSDWKKMSIVSVLMIFFTVGFIALGNKYAESGMVTLILCTVPIFTCIIECFILKSHKLTAKVSTGLIGGFIGICIIVFFGSNKMEADIIGILFTLAAAIVWSSSSLYSRSVEIEGSIISQTAVEALFAACLFFLAGKILGDFEISNITFKSLIPVFYLSIFDSLIGFISYVYLLKVWKPSRVSTYAYINPVVALILGSIVLNETITIGKVVGTIIIIISVILVQSENRKNKDTLITVTN